MNRQTGARVDPNATTEDMMSNQAGTGNARGLMSAVSQLPALIERKRTIEKHSAILHGLLSVCPFLVCCKIVLFKCPCCIWQWCLRFMSAGASVSA